MWIWIHVQLLQNALRVPYREIFRQQSRYKSKTSSSSPYLWYCLNSLSVLYTLHMWFVNIYWFLLFFRVTDRNLEIRCFIPLWRNLFRQRKLIDTNKIKIVLLTLFTQSKQQCCWGSRKPDRVNTHGISTPTFKIV